MTAFGSRGTQDEQAAGNTSPKVLGIILPALLGVALFAGVLFLMLLPQAEQGLRSKKREMIKEIVRVAWGIADNFHQQAEAGLIDKDEAQARAISTLRALRYGPHRKDYFWVNDLAPRMIMHPYRNDLVGKDLSHYEDPKGKRLFVEAAGTARRDGAGFIHYHWQWLDNPNQILPKISYVKLFKPWGWVIGSGLYEDDVDREVAGLIRGLSLPAAGIVLLVALLSGYLVLRSLRLERQRLAARQELWETSEQYKAVLDGSPDPMVVYDNTGGALYVNRAFTRVFGWSLPELLGRRVEFVPEDEREKTMAAIKEIYNSASPLKTFDSRRYTKDGQVLDVIVSAAIYHGLSGPRAGMVVILTVVTEQKKTQRALAESEQRYRDLFDSISDLIYTQDLTGRFRTVNRALAELFGYRADELIGRQATDMMKPEVRLAFEKEYLNKVRDEGRHFGTSAYFAKNGTKRYIEYKSNLVTPEEGEPYISGTGRDVTERIMAERKLKRMSAQLSQAQKMEAVGTLASGIAHDFNNILQGISGYLQLLMSEEAAPSDRRHYLEEMDYATQRGAQMVRRLLAFSRKEPPQLSPLDLNREVSHAIGLLERTVPKMINIQAELAIDLLPVNGDPGQLEQVVMNLGSNAADAMPQGGNLALSTKNVTLNEAFCATQVDLSPGGYVLLTVADNGHGMPPELVERIFEPFFTTKGANRGTGLGLSTAYGIVKNHGGVILCHSQPGRGTVFSVYLPALTSREMPAIQAPSTPRPAVGGSETLLVVDDEPGILETVAEMLSRVGYRVITAKSGEEALTAFGRERGVVDLAILDLNMPGMGGKRCLAELKKLAPDIKVIVASGYSHMAERDQATGEAPAAFLGKPYSFDGLLTLVRRLLDD